MATWMAGTRGRGEDPNRAWRELAHLASAVRVNGEVRAALGRVVTATPGIVGFAAATLLMRAGTPETMEVIAATGPASADMARLMGTTVTLSQLAPLLTQEHTVRSGRSFRVRPTELGLVAAFTPARPSTSVRADAWGPADTLLMPLRATTGGALSGLLTLALPTDQHIPTDITLDLAEAVCDLLLMVSENGRIYAGAERTRQMLESGVTEIMRQVEQARRGNFTVQLPVKDSFLGVISDLFNEMMARIGGGINGMRVASEVVSINANTVGILVDTATTDAQAQARQIADVSANITAIAASIDLIAAASIEAASVAETARELSAGGRLAIEDAVRGMDGMRQTALHTTQTVKLLVEYLHEIEGIVGTVMDFTARMNILALNASIEAGRVGDAGRGFLPIAQEIRSLALTSATQVQQIAGRIKNIQGEASVVMVSINDSTERVVEQSDRVNDAGTALQGIAELTQEIAALNEGIRESAGAEARRTAALVGAMGDILAITDATRDSVGQIAGAMAELIDLAQSLRHQITQFALDQNLSVAEMEHTAARIPRVGPLDAQ